MVDCLFRLKCNRRLCSLVLKTNSFNNSKMSNVGEWNLQKTMLFGILHKNSSKDFKVRMEHVAWTSYKALWVNSKLWLVMYWYNWRRSYEAGKSMPATNWIAFFESFKVSSAKPNSLFHFYMLFIVVPHLTESIFSMAATRKKCWISSHWGQPW